MKSISTGENRRTSNWKLYPYTRVWIGFSVKCYLPIIFSVCCLIRQFFLMFTISGENTVPCLEAFGEKTVSVHRKNISFTYEHNEISVFFLRNLPQSSDINGSHRKSSIIIDNCRKMAENSLSYTKENNIGPFGAVFWLFLAWKKLLLQCILYCSCCNLTVSCYRTKKVLIVIEVPPFIPS